MVGEWSASHEQLPGKNLSGLEFSFQYNIFDGLVKSGNSIEFVIPAKAGVTNFYESIIFDGFVKSRKSRHSCEGRSPELLELTGFPLAPE